MQSRRRIAKWVLEQFDFALHVDSLPFGQLVELDGSHFEEFLERLAVQMAFQMATVHLFRQRFIGCLQLV